MKKKIIFIENNHIAQRNMEKLVFNNMPDMKKKYQTITGLVDDDITIIGNEYHNGTVDRYSLDFEYISFFDVYDAINYVIKLKQENPNLDLLTVFSVDGTDLIDDELPFTTSAEEEIVNNYRREVIGVITNLEKEYGIKVLYNAISFYYNNKEYAIWRSGLGNHYYSDVYAREVHAYTNVLEEYKDDTDNNVYNVINSLLTTHSINSQYLGLVLLKSIYLDIWNKAISKNNPQLVLNNKKGC